MVRRHSHSRRKARRQFLLRQTAVARQEKRQRHRFTLNLRFWESVSRSHLNCDGADVREHREILDKFNEVLGDGWTKHARKALPQHRPEDCDTKRPCRKILCEYNLAVERTRLGSLRLVHPNVPIQHQETCQWDVIRKNPDGLSLEAIGNLFAMGRPRVHGIWREIQAKLQRLRPDLAGKLEEDLVKAEAVASPKRVPEVPPVVEPESGVYPPHPAADIFPPLEDEQLDELAADIKANGLHDAIELLDNTVLDGRNRYAACILAGVEPRFVQWTARPGETPLSYVLTKNLHRRHLTESQRAMVAAKVREYLMPAAKERQEASRAKPGERVGSPSVVKAGTNSAKPERTAVQAAVELNISPTSVKAASTVLEHGTPELVKAVQDGKASVSAAAAVATLTPAKQRAAASLGKQGVAKAAQKIREKKARDTLTKQSVDKPAQVVKRLLDDVKAAVKSAVAKWPKAVSKRDLVVVLRGMAEDLEAA
jgi:hypothetical protein